MPGVSRFMDLDGPLGTNALSFSPPPRLHYIGPNAQVRTEQRPHAKLFVHKEKYGTVCIHIPTCLDRVRTF